MKILLDGDLYEVSGDEQYHLLSYVEKMAMAEYDRLDSGYRLLTKTVAREILRRMEDKARQDHGKDAALYFRPERGSDPVPFCSKIFCSILAEILKRVTISISTRDHTVTGITGTIESQSQSGG